jgi:ABC-type glycerol-3-phosphate transport system substrate-binding protein
MFYKKMCSLFLLIIFLAGCSASYNQQSVPEIEKVDAEGRKVIRFSCANLLKADESILTGAAAQFEKEHPDAVVEIQDFSRMGLDINKYISTANTELMAGKGPDIMPITYLPAIKYYKKNIFADLGSMMEKDKNFHGEDLLTNVLEASKYNGTLYAIPIEFSIQGIIGASQALEEENITINDATWKTADFIEIARKVTKDLNGDGTIDRYALPQIPMEAVTSFFITTGRYIDYENKKVLFDSPEFIALLKLLKTISDEKLSHKKFNIYQQIPYKNSKEVVFGGGPFDGYRFTLSMKYNLGGGKRSLYKLPVISGSDDYMFDSNMMLAIVNTSENKELAWEFIKILLSEDTQEKYAWYSDARGFPINKTALMKQREEVDSLGWTVGDDSGWAEIYFREEEHQFIENYINHINAYQYRDIRIENIIVKEIGDLFSKKLSFSNRDAEDIARKIQSKVQLYLDE